MLNAKVRPKKSKATTSNLHLNVDASNVEPLTKNWIGQSLFAKNSSNYSTNLQLWFNLRAGVGVKRTINLHYKLLNISWHSETLLPNSIDPITLKLISLAHNLRLVGKKLRAMKNSVTTRTIGQVKMHKLAVSSNQIQHEIKGHKKGMKICEPGLCTLETTAHLSAKS